jgi:hypothetical protein
VDEAAKSGTSVTSRRVADTMRGMRWIALVAFHAAVAGCYSPKVRDCEQACGPQSSCGPGLTCDNAVCRDPDRVGTACVETEDASPPTADVNPEDCTWDLVSTNFSPADVADPAPTAWDVTADETFTTGGVDGHAVSQNDADPLWIVHHSSFTVAEGTTLTIEGTHALVIAADTIEIKGTIILRNGGVDATCDAARGTDACNAGAGGGGGGYGGVGGDGGGLPSANGGLQTGILATPLRAGCPGAQGGDGRTVADATPRLGGLGGVAGGALQLSARLSISVEGTITANGSAGRAGKSDPAGGGACPGFTGRASGGGGGGGGGTIFIESCATVVAATAKLCANGGGGGGGAGGGSTDTGIDGQDGSCETAALGGAGEIAGEQGGAGGFDGVPAAAGGITNRGGGGGGGAVGRIHIQQLAGPPVTTGATIRPPANRSQ